MRLLGKAQGMPDCLLRAAPYAWKSRQHVWPDRRCCQWLAATNCPLNTFSTLNEHTYARAPLTCTQGRDAEGSGGLRCAVAAPRNQQSTSYYLIALNDVHISTALATAWLQASQLQVGCRKHRTRKLYGCQLPCTTPTQLSLQRACRLQTFTRQFCSVRCTALCMVPHYVKTLNTAS